MNPRAQRTMVAGGGGGIGRAAALRLGARGDTVVVMDKDGPAAARTAAAVTSAGGSAVHMPVDVTDDEQVRRSMAAAVAELGGLDVLVNSVGIQGPGLGLRSHEITPEQLDQVYRVNLRAAFLLSTEAITVMLPARYGRVLHVASIAGKEGNPGMIGYSTTKAGLIGMVKAQGKEYAADGITVNAVAPAVIATEFLDTQPEEVVAYMTQRIPMGRPGTVEEVAAVIAWATSPEASFTTGFCLDASGGRATA